MWLNLFQAFHPSFRKRLRKLQQQVTLMQEAIDQQNRVIAAMPGNVYWVDRDGNMLGCNLNQAVACGVKNAAELKGKNIFDAGKMLKWDEEIPQEIDWNNKRVMETQQDHIVEERIILNNEERFFLSHKSPLYDSKGHVIGIIGIGTDITDRKKMELQLKLAKEKAEEASEVKTQFIRNMQHDLRTPTSGITELLNYYSTIETNPKRKSELQILSQAGNQLLNLINQVLDFDTVEKGLIPLRLQSINLRQLISNLIDLHKPAAQLHSLNLELTLDASLPEMIQIDTIRLERILINLISNAIKFTPDGYIKVRASAEERPDNQVSLIISVEDSGIGIPEEKHHIVFDEFVRLSPSNQGKYTGSGLGLSIAKRFAHDINGNIHIANNKDKGSCFTLTCLATKGNPNYIDPVDIPIPTNHHKTQMHQYTILLVEDEPIAQLLGKALLTDHFNCQLLLANNAEEAIKIAETIDHLDLIFMDIGLPDQSGYLCATTLREKFPKLHHTPIIPLTAHNDLASKQTASKYALQDFLIKPLTTEKISAIFDKWLT